MLGETVSKFFGQILSPSRETPGQFRGQNQHSVLPQILRWVLGLYLVATWSSIAGMEIMGWLMFLLVLGYFFTEHLVEKGLFVEHGLVVKHGPAEEIGLAETKWRSAEISTEPSQDKKSPAERSADTKTHRLLFKETLEVLPWKACLLLFALTAIGIFINGTPDADKVFIIGTQRWIFLFLSLSLTLTLWFPSHRGFQFFAVFTSIIAIYAVVQSFTGLDLLRPGSHRAVQPMDSPTATRLYRSAGLFGSPMQYIYVYGQYACFFIASTMLLWSDRRSRKFLFRLSLVASILLLCSMLTTFVRGGWISLGSAIVVMTYVFNKQWAKRLVIAGGLILIVMFVGFEGFRLRILSLFDPTYSSNSDRLLLWKMNWQMFLDYPIFGIGYEENETRAREYLIKMGFPTAFGGHAHNNYLQFLAGMGLTGFLTFLYIIFSMFKATWNLYQTLPKEMIWPRTIALGAFGAQIHLHVGGLTECNFKTGVTNHNVMVVWASVIALTALQKSGLLRSRVQAT